MTGPPVGKIPTKGLGMRHCCKLNLISMLFACIFVIVSEYWMNAYRLYELSDSGQGPGERWIKILLWAAVAVLSVGSVYLVHKWMKFRPSALWAALLWFPYAILFIWLIGHFGPGRHPADSGNYAAGMVILLLAAGYPFFVGLAAFIGIVWPSWKRQDGTEGSEQ